MLIRYPKEFSEVARARVEIAEIGAARRLAAARLDKGARPTRDWPAKAPRHDWSLVEQQVIEYVLGVFLPYALECCSLGRQRIWTIDKVRQTAEHFLLQMTLDAPSDQGLSDHFSSFYLGSYAVGLTGEYRRVYTASQEWVEYTNAVLKISKELTRKDDLLAKIRESLNQGDRKQAVELRIELEGCTINEIIDSIDHGANRQRETVEKAFKQWRAKQRPPAWADAAIEKRLLR